MILEKSTLQLSCTIEGESFPYFAHPPGEDRITFELIVLMSILDPLFGLANLILFNQGFFFAMFFSSLHSVLESIFLGVMNMTDFMKLMNMSIILFPLLVCIVISFSMFGSFLRINYGMGIIVLIASLC